MTRFFAMLYGVDYRVESPDDRLYRFESKKDRARFLADTYGDPVYPRSLPVRAEDVRDRFSVERGRWEHDEHGEYLLPRA